MPTNLQPAASSYQYSRQTRPPVRPSACPPVRLSACPLVRLSACPPATK
jgi:hypothetical protein